MRVCECTRARECACECVCVHVHLFRSLPACPAPQEAVCCHSSHFIDEKAETQLTWVHKASERQSSNPHLLLSETCGLHTAWPRLPLGFPRYTKNPGPGQHPGARADAFFKTAAALRGLWWGASARRDTASPSARPPLAFSKCIPQQLFVIGVSGIHCGFN